jgi:hypothetical protein
LIKSLQLSIHLYQTPQQESKPANVDGMARIYVRPTLTFVGFGLRAFTETEKTSQPPNGKVYWVVKDPQNGCGFGHKMKFARTISYEPSGSKNVNP